MMNLFTRKLSLGIALAAGLCAVLPLSASAENHVVSPAQMQQDLSAASAARQKNEQAVRSFLSTPQAERALQMAGVQPQQASNAVSQLSDSELAQLATRSQNAQKDFAAGKLSDHDLLLIAVAILALLLLVAIVH